MLLKIIFVLFFIKFNYSKSPSDENLALRKKTTLIINKIYSEVFTVTNGIYGDFLKIEKPFALVIELLSCFEVKVVYLLLLHDFWGFFIGLHSSFVLKNFYHNKNCANFTGTVIKDNWMSIKCSPKNYSTSMVSISSEKTGIFNVSEIKVYGEKKEICYNKANIAQGNKNYRWNGKEVVNYHLLTDGNFNDVTPLKNILYFIVDLVEFYIVKEVELFGNYDLLQENREILIGLHSFFNKFEIISNNLCTNFIFKSMNLLSHQVSCKKPFTISRYVSLYYKNKMNLSISELEVYGIIATQFKYLYIGCYKYLIGNIHNYSSIQGCIRFCIGKGTIIGMRRKNQCICTNLLSKAYPSSYCKDQCLNGENFCGGENFFSVYRVKPCLDHYNGFLSDCNINGKGG